LKAKENRHSGGEKPCAAWCIGRSANRNQGFSHNGVSLKRTAFTGVTVFSEIIIICIKGKEKKSVVFEFLKKVLKKA